jgi:hypothetical protein
MNLKAVHSNNVQIVANQNDLFIIFV